MNVVTKIRICVNGKQCQFKNLWWDARQCLAEFHIWNTCLNKDKIEVIKKKEKNG